MSARSQRGGQIDTSQDLDRLYPAGRRRNIHMRPQYIRILRHRTCKRNRSCTYRPPNCANLTVYDVVSMGRSPYTGFWGSLGSKDIEVVEESIELVRINDLRDRRIDTLSDGERQKVMIAKTLSQQTPVIILDEPTAFLDYPSKVEMMQLLQRLARERGKTVFLSTHDIELALHIADRIWLLDKTLGFRAGTPEELSLAGDIGRFFRREGIEYDPESRHFIIRAIPD